MIDNRPLELSGDELRRLVVEVTDRLATHLDELPSRPATDVDDAEEVARALRQPLPEQGTDRDEVLDTLFERAIPKSYTASGPGYLAYIPGGGLPHAAVADLVAGVVNRYTGVWRAAPALVELEADVLRWFGDMVGYPESARGILTSGGSLANLSAVVTAREAKDAREDRTLANTTVYSSDQVHHSMTKAARLAGIPPANVRSVASDGDFRLDLAALEEAVAADRERGMRPFLLVASAGTVATGAVDDLVACAEFAAEHGLWLHVDAAYGGFFVLTERGRAILAGIEQADSITLDPHKGLFLPYGTGCLLVRDGAALRDAHSLHADYLPELPGDDEFVDFSTLSPELSRPYRGLRIWLPMQLVGAEAFREQLDEKLDLAHLASEELAAMPEIDLVAPPELSLLAFRWRPDGVEDDELDDLNRRLLDRINARQRVFLTGATVDGDFLLRICVLSFRTHEDRIRMAIEDIRSGLSELATDG